MVLINQLSRYFSKYRSSVPRVVSQVAELKQKKDEQEATWGFTKLGNLKIDSQTVRFLYLSGPPKGTREFRKPPLRAALFSLEIAGESKGSEGANEFAGRHVPRP